MHLLNALESQGKANKLGRRHEFTYQHRLSNNFESLIWVIVYAMMVRRRNLLAATDSKAYEDFMGDLDLTWGVHSYVKLVVGHDTLIGAGCNPNRTVVEETWFLDPFEAEFFRAAMRLVRPHIQERESITYEKLKHLLGTYIRKAAQANAP